MSSVGEDCLVDVEDEDDGLHGEEPEFADGLEVEAADREQLTALESVLRRVRRIEDRRVDLLAADFLLVPGDRLLDGLEVGEHQLSVDRLHVGCRVHRTVDVHHVVVGETTHDLSDRVGLADVREELVAQPLPLAGAAHDAGDVDERHRSGQDALAAEDLRELVEPRVRQVHHADVGLDRRERIVRCEHVVLGECVEEGGLADVGQADDSDSESHGERVYLSRRVPSSDRSPVAISRGARGTPSSRRAD